MIIQPHRYNTRTKNITRYRAYSLASFPVLLYDMLSFMSNETDTIPSPEELGLNPGELEKFAAQFNDGHSHPGIKHIAAGKRPQQVRSDDDLMSFFSRDLAGYKVLPHKELFSYLEVFKETRDPKALAQIVYTNVPLVKRIAGKEKRKIALEYTDLVQSGIIGLMRAAEKFDITRGYQFTTYATWWIVHTMRRAGADFSRPIRLPARRYEEISRFQRAWQQLAQDTGTEPTFEEVAKAMELTNVGMHYLDLAFQRNTVSLDAALSIEPDDSEHTLEHYLADPEPGTEEQVVRNDPIALSAYLSVLTEREKKSLTFATVWKAAKE